MASIGTQCKHFVGIGSQYAFSSYDFLKQSKTLLTDSSV